MNPHVHESQVLHRTASRWIAGKDDNNNNNTELSYPQFCFRCGGVLFLEHTEILNCRTTAQAVSRLFLTAEARFVVAVRAGFYQSTSVFPCQLPFHRCLILSSVFRGRNYIERRSRSTKCLTRPWTTSGTMSANQASALPLDFW
jgi:hypothetical protein